MVMADIRRQGFDLGREGGRVVVIGKPLLEIIYRQTVEAGWNSAWPLLL